MNARWIRRILRGGRAGERHCALNHAALFERPALGSKVRSLERCCYA